MPFTDGPAPTAAQPGPTTATTTTYYTTPTNSDLAAVAATVSVVGVLMALLITWLILRLRHAGQSNSTPIPIAVRRPARPSMAPSEASSKFGFIRKPLRLSHRHQDGSWDFADPDPFSHPKESPLDRTPSQKHRPAPLTPVPTYTPRAHRTSTHKDDLSPRTPTMDCIEPPPPAYCRENAAWPVSRP